MSTMRTGTWVWGGGASRWNRSKARSCRPWTGPGSAARRQSARPRTKSGASQRGSKRRIPPGRSPLGARDRLRARGDRSDRRRSRRGGHCDDEALEGGIRDASVAVHERGAAGGGASARARTARRAGHRRGRSEGGRDVEAGRKLGEVRGSTDARAPDQEEVGVHVREGQVGGAAAERDQEREVVAAIRLAVGVDEREARPLIRSLLQSRS